MSRVALPFAPESVKNGTGPRAVPVATVGLGRASWTGFLKLGLVAVPVKAYPMVVAREEVELHQLHARCGQRIRLQKHCPQHGPVEGEEVVKGYEHAPGQHVLLGHADLEQLRAAADKAVTLDWFLEEGQLEPALFAGKSFYLLPDGPAAQRPYAVLAEALRRRRKWGVGRAVLSGRRSAVVVRLSGRLLSLDVLHDPTRLQRVGEENVTAVHVTDEEVGLAGLLIDAATGEVCWSDYHDDTAEKLAALIEAKLHGHTLSPPPPEEVTVLPFLDALKQSVAMVPEPEPRLQPAPRRARKQTSRKPARQATRGSSLP